METALTDAAFRLVSHSLEKERSGIQPFASDETRLMALRQQFPSVDPVVIAESYAQAVELGETAIQLADAEQGSGNGIKGPPLISTVLAARCPGFSEETYYAAINDGFVLTRK